MAATREVLRDSIGQMGSVFVDPADPQACRVGLLIGIGPDCLFLDDVSPEGEGRGLLVMPFAADLRFDFNSSYSLGFKGFESSLPMEAFDYVGKSWQGCLALALERREYVWVGHLEGFSAGRLDRFNEFWIRTAHEFEDDRPDYVEIVRMGRVLFVRLYGEQRTWDDEEEAED